MMKKRKKIERLVNLSARTWALVASRTGAKVFETNSRLSAGRQLQSIEHPEGSLKNGEINSDRPGRTQDRFGQGRHSMMCEYSPTETVTQEFAHRLGALLEKARAERKFENLILVAPPRFLGELRSKLSALTTALIRGEFRKDLIPCHPKELKEQLSQMVRESLA